MPDRKMNADLFHETMRNLFRHMEIALPRELENDVYSVKVDQDIEMNFFCDPAGFLNAVANLGTLPEKPEEMLFIKLLYFNSFIPLHPNLNVSVDPKDRSVEVWTRQKLTELNEDTTQQFFHFILRAIEGVKAVLAPPAEPSTQDDTLRQFGRPI